MAVQLVAVPMTGGVNLLDDPRRIRDDELVRAKNVIPDRSGMPQKRLGAAIHSIVTAGANWPMAFASSPTAGIDFAAVYQTNADIPQTFFRVWSIISAGSLEIPYLEGYRPALVPFDGALYCLPGKKGGSFTGNMVRATSSGGVATVTSVSFNGTGNSTIVPKVACTYRNRMVYAVGRKVFFSDRWDPLTIGDDVLAASGSHISFDAMGGDEVVAMIEITQSAASNGTNSALLVLGHWSAFIVTGEPSETADVGADYGGDAQVMQLQNVGGCSSHQTLVRTPYGVIWAGSEDVWAFDIGQLPRRIGSKIGPALKNTPADRQYLWHAAYHDGFYRLAVASEGQNPAHLARMHEQWWLDLREGPAQHWREARWWGPMVYRIPYQENITARSGTFVMAMDQRIGVEPALYTLCSESTQLNVLRLDATSGYDYGRIASYTIDGVVPQYPAEDKDNEISIDILTKEYDFDDPMSPKQYLGGELNVWNDQPARLAVEVIFDGGRRRQTKYVSLNPAGDIEGVDQSVGNESRIYQSILVEPDYDIVEPGKVIQFRVYDVPGFAVPEEELGSAVIFAPYPGLGVGAVQIVPGFYSNISAYLDAIVAATGGEISHNQNTTPRAWFVSLSKAALGGIFLNTFDHLLPPNIAEHGRSTRLMSTFLGFPTDADIDVGLAATAAASVPSKLSSAIELGGIVFRIYQFGRRPKHVGN